MRHPQHIPLVAFMALIAQPSMAQRFDDTVSLKLEAYFAGIGSHARIGTPSGSLGTEIDFERHLGMANNRTLPAVEIGWRINDDWVLQG